VVTAPGMASFSNKSPVSLTNWRSLNRGFFQVAETYSKSVSSDNWSAPYWT
jgi:hypothetical protein